MAPIYRRLSTLMAVLVLAGISFAQDSPSLGDLARQQRQKKAAQGKDAKPAKVITNAEISAHSASAPETQTSEAQPASSAPAASNDPKEAEHWKSQIQAQKSQIASLEKQIDQINQSIQFAPGNCVEGCVEWNKRQQEKQQQAERMQSQLQEQKNQLEQMQESARKQGYGSSVYDP
jgi:hypothetical protein